jgi:hypothetical protein
MRGLVAIVVVVVACGRLDFDPQRATGDGGADSGLPPCTTNVCECSADADCSAAHTFCAAHSGSHTCDCAAGYSGAPCLWTGVVADPGFQSTSMWTTTATIDNAIMQSGMLDPGEVKLTGLVRATQTVTMPRRTLAEPLVLAVSSLRHGMQDKPSVGVGKYWIDTTSGAIWVNTRSCLGAAMYAPESTSGFGVPVTLQVMPTVSATELDVDHVDIVPAMPGECAPIGPIVNGDSETSGNWTFVATPANGPDGTFAGFAAGRGAGGSRGARLFTTHVCDQTKLTLQISPLPFEELPSAALSYWVDSSAGAQTTFSGALAPANLIGTGAATTLTSCIPAPMRGMPNAIGASENDSGTCANVLNWDTVFDDVAIVGDAACGSNPDIADPGFESASLPFGLRTSPPTGTARIDTSVVHGGAASLRFGATFTCNSTVSWSALVFPSASAPNAGPALEYYYRATPINRFQVVVQATAAQATLIQDNTWRRGVVCFNAQLAGRPQVASFTLTDVATSMCAQTVAEEAVNFDDLAVVTDPACQP